MDKETPNYGMEREPESGYGHGYGGEYGSRPAPGRLPYGPYGGPGGLSAGDERTWSVLAHLSTFLNLFTGFLGPVAAFVVWLVYRDRSPAVAAHALRSVFYQVAWLTAIVVGWTVTGLLTVVFVGFLLVPVMLLVTLGMFVQGAYEAYKAYAGTNVDHL